MARYRHRYDLVLVTNQGAFALTVADAAGRQKILDTFVLATSADWFDWPTSPDLFPESFPGFKTSCDGFLVDADLDRLMARIADYFDPALSHEDIRRRYPGVMKTSARFDARAVRDALLHRGGPDEACFV